MPRIPRYLQHRPEGTFHIVIRGNSRNAVFHHPDDFRVYLDLLRAEVCRGSFLLHHYALMSNHVHTIVTLAPEHTLSMPMKRIHLGYSRHHAETYGRSGHLWEERFSSFLIDTDSYLLTCGIYVALNPFRAGICTDPIDYPWSSHKAYVTAEHLDIITHDPAYLGLAPQPRSRRSLYRNLTQMWASQRPDARRIKRFFASSPTSLFPEPPISEK